MLQAAGEEEEANSTPKKGSKASKNGGRKVSRADIAARVMAEAVNPLPTLVSTRGVSLHQCLFTFFASLDYPAASTGGKGEGRASQKEEDRRVRRRVPQRI